MIQSQSSLIPTADFLHIGVLYFEIIILAYKILLTVSDIGTNLLLIESTGSKKVEVV